MMSVSAIGKLRARASPDIQAPVVAVVACRSLAPSAAASLKHVFKHKSVASVPADVAASSIAGISAPELPEVVSDEDFGALTTQVLCEAIAGNQLWGYLHRRTKMVHFTECTQKAMRKAGSSTAYFTMHEIAKAVAKGLGGTLKAFTLRFNYSEASEAGDTTTCTDHKDGGKKKNVVRVVLRYALKDGKPAPDAATGSLLMQSSDGGWWEITTACGDMVVFAPWRGGHGEYEPGGYGGTHRHQGEAFLVANTVSVVGVLDILLPACQYALPGLDDQVALAGTLRGIVADAKAKGFFSTNVVFPDLATTPADFISMKHPQADAGATSAINKASRLGKAYPLPPGVRLVMDVHKGELSYYSDHNHEFVSDAKIIEMSKQQSRANSAAGGHARAAPGGGITPEELALARAMAKEQLAAGDTRFARHSLSDVLGKQKSKNASNAMSNQRRRSRKKGSTAKEHQLRKGATHKFPSTLQAALEAEVDSRVSADGYSWHGRGAPKAVMAHMQSSSAVAAMPEEELPLLEVLRQASKPGISISTDKVWKALRYVIENRRYEVQERRGGPTRQQQKEEKEEEKKKKAAAGGGGGGGGGRGGGGRGGGRGGGAAAAAAAAAGGGGAGGGGGGRGGKALGVAGGRVKKAK